MFIFLKRHSSFSFLYFNVYLHNDQHLHNFTVLFFAVWSLQRMVFEHRCRCIGRSCCPARLVDRVHELELRSVIVWAAYTIVYIWAGIEVNVSGRRARKSPIVRCARNGALVSAWSPGSVPVPPPVLRPVHIDRHSAPPSKTLVFSFINIRSLTNKIDDLLETGRDATLIAETWHDTESVCLDRLRAGGYQVVDQPRPCPAAAMDTIRTNHGGLAVVAGPSVFRAALCSRCVWVVFRRRRSRPPKVKKEAETDQTAMSGFFVELGDALDRVVPWRDRTELFDDQYLPAR